MCLLLLERCRKKNRILTGGVMNKKTRKQRKQERKNKQTSWLTPSLDKAIRKVASKMMRERIDKKNKLPLHDRFYCNDCKRAYCLNNDGKVMYCSECYFGRPPKNLTKGCEWGGCLKKIQAIRSCKSI